MLAMIETTFLLYLIVLGFCIFYYVGPMVKFTRINWMTKGHLVVPFVGNLYQFLSLTNGLTATHEIFTEFGLRTRLWIFNTFLYMTIHPEDLKILINNEDSMEKATWFYYTGRPLVGDGLLVSDLYKWKTHRKILNKCFTKSILDNNIEQIYTKSTTLIDDLKKFVSDSSNDIYPYMFNFTLETFCKNFLDFECFQLNQKYQICPNLIEHNRQTFYRMVNPCHAFDSIYKHTENYRLHSNSVHNIHKFIETIIEEKCNSNDKSTITGILIKSLLDPANGFNDVEIKDEIVTLTVGGTESTALTLSFSALILGGYPEIQKRLYDEVVSVVGTERPIILEDLPKLEYTERFLNEILRLFPPLPLIARKTRNDIKLNHCVLPKRSEFVTSIYTLHRHPMFWKEPLKFDPDRFLPEESAKRPPYTFIPFSMGRRNCIGWKYSMNVMKVSLAHLVRNYEFESEFTSIERFQVIAYVFINIESGFRCSIKPRPIK